MPAEGKPYPSVRPKGAPPKKAKKQKRLPRVVRGVLNFLNEEQAAATENYPKLRELKKNPKY